MSCYAYVCGICYIASYAQHTPGPDNSTTWQQSSEASIATPLLVSATSRGAEQPQQAAQIHHNLCAPQLGCTKHAIHKDDWHLQRRCNLLSAVNPESLTWCGSMTVD